MQALLTDFETPRLVARLPRPSDAPLLFDAYTNDPGVSRYMVWKPHESVQETDAFIQRCMEAIEAGTRYPFVLSMKERPHEPIGMLEARPSAHAIDLGYVLAPRYWGKGFMPEAVLALTTWALSQDTFFRVQAFCDVQNKPSQRTLEKAGFLREGRHERFVVHPNLSREPRPCFMYARCR